MKSDWRGFDGSLVESLHTGSGKNDHFVMSRFSDAADIQDAYMLKIRQGCEGGGKGALVEKNVSYTLGTSQDQTMFQPDGEHYVVRRLMPVECERLQAFPDGWTDITGCDVDAVTEKVARALRYEPESNEYKALRRKVKKWSDGTPDTPRYKAMGNSMTTLVIELLGRRIQAYDELHYDEVGLG